jgi:hypothetical protein
MKNYDKWILRSLKSKTILFSLVLTVLSTIQASLGVFTSFLSPTAYGILGMIVGVIVAVLRYVTTQPLTEK